MKAERIKNIDFVNKNGLCTECGTCYGVCPRDNIVVTVDNVGQYSFKINDPQKCEGCHLCYTVCPGFEVDFQQLYTSIFPGSSDFHAIIGHHSGIYLGYSVDDKVRSKAASGGVTSALLCYALETGKIEGVFVVRMQNADEGDPLSPKVYLATTKEEVLRAQQSKYITVPMNMCLREIIRDKSDKRYAFVGLACQMHGLRKAEQQIPRLRRKIVLRIGLICGHSMNRLGTRHLLRLVNARESDVEYIEYRAKQWPGNFLAKLKNGGEIMISHPDWTSYVLTAYEKWRCHFCPDPLCELADVSVGDPWLPQLRGERGYNLIISRTDCGVEFLEDAQKAGVIEAFKVDPHKVIESQGRSLYRKKHLISAYVKLAKLLRRPVPCYAGLKTPNNLSLRDYCEVVFLQAVRTLASKDQAQGLMPFLGKLFLKLKTFKRRK